MKKTATKRQRYFDISPPITPELANFPGIPPFRRSVALDMQRGDHITVSSMEISLHLGAHADGPNHYGRDSVGIGERDLSPYFGSCEVFRVRLKPKARIQVADLERSLGNRRKIAPRVLFRTDSFANPNRWHNDFNALSPELILWLAARGVCLVGIDTPSIDPADCQTMDAHRAILKKNMAILEGLDLSRIKAGAYQLIALPLRIPGADASPVRAILLP